MIQQFDTERIIFCHKNYHKISNFNFREEFREEKSKLRFLKYFKHSSYVLVYLLFI